MSNYLDVFKNEILNPTSLDVQHPSLRISTNENFTTQYAPFDYINRDAQIVLLGITPGSFQANAALSRLKTDLIKNVAHTQALKNAKEFASFSGPMRSNLVKMLDAVGVQNLLSIETCASLFESHSELVHFTSALRYPVFHGGKNYSGTPAILSSEYLKDSVNTWLAEETKLLSNALWVPLGKEPTSAIEYLMHKGLVPAKNIILGLPHPSGANAERIAYFLGNKARESLSSKTNPDKLDHLKYRLITQINSLISNRK